MAAAETVVAYESRRLTAEEKKRHLLSFGHGDVEVAGRISAGGALGILESLNPVDFSRY